MSEWYVELLPGIDIQPNPFGAGLVLCVHRGNVAENRVDVVSVHTTNTPDKEDVEAVKVGMKAKIEELDKALALLCHYEGLIFISVMHAFLVEFTHFACLNYYDRTF